MKPDVIIHVIWALGALAVANFVYQAIMNRGLKGVVFRAPIKRTVGELDLGKSGPMSIALKVHCLESRTPDAPTVGIELVTRSIASYHMMPIRLRPEQATTLSGLLSQAVAESQGALHLITR